MAKIVKANCRRFREPETALEVTSGDMATVERLATLVAEHKVVPRPVLLGDRSSLKLPCPMSTHSDHSQCRQANLVATSTTPELFQAPMTRETLKRMSGFQSHPVKIHVTPAKREHFSQVLLVVSEST